MKWSTLLLSGSIGIGAGAAHVVPFVVEVITMSFDEQLVRKLQSAHTTNTFPLPSMPDAGSGKARRPPSTPRMLSGATMVVLPQLCPPSVDMNEPIAI